MTPIGQTEQQRFQSALELSECRGCVMERLRQWVPACWPNTAKLRGSYTDVLVYGTARSPRVKELRQLRSETFESGWHISTRYDGAMPWRQQLL